MYRFCKMLSYWAFKYLLSRTTILSTFQVSTYCCLGFTLILSQSVRAKERIHIEKYDFNTCKYSIMSAAVCPTDSMLRLSSHVSPQN